jgi:hypothetical protein
VGLFLYSRLRLVLDLDALSPSSVEHKPLEDLFQVKSYAVFNFIGKGIERDLIYSLLDIFLLIVVWLLE